MRWWLQASPGFTCPHLPVSRRTRRAARLLGLVARRALDDEEFQLLGIFADQAAMAIKSAQLFRELQRYRDRLEVENAYLQEQLHEERG